MTFEHGGPMPCAYALDGEDLSLPLQAPTALVFPAPDHAFAFHWPFRLGDYRILPRPMIGIVVLDDDPIIRPPELLGAGSIREQGREVPFAAIGMEDGQQRDSFRVESLWGDPL